ncbi:MAG: NTP transferase domain-containing protein [Clostridiales bacterium]|nr:NTP transferase domain-containing protein [Clostridiales bacterium]
MKKTALIMAGGRGERFWPRSRKSLPKQFLSLTNDGKTMIQLTVERILPLVDMEDIYIATNKDYKNLVLEQLPGIPKQNILCEPVGRNTAPCIGLGAVHIASKYEDAIMMVLPSDHLIKVPDIFTETLEQACEIASEDTNLVTIGIQPNYPETGYGYIKMNKEISKGTAYSVDCFVEKPNLEKAKAYVSSGSYVWNSGMFIWKISSILSNLQKYLPNMYSGLKNIQASIGTDSEEDCLISTFPTLESISIDYGIMEKASNIYVIPGNFGWDDVGSWLAIERIKGYDESNNTISGNVIAIDTNNCIIEAKEKLIATVGVENLVIVDTDDALLVSGKDFTGNIRKVLETLREQKAEKYL